MGFLNRRSSPAAGPGGRADAQLGLLPSFSDEAVHRALVNGFLETDRQYVEAAKRRESGRACPESRVS